MGIRTRRAILLQEYASMSEVGPLGSERTCVDKVWGCCSKMRWVTANDGLSGAGQAAISEALSRRVAAGSACMCQGLALNPHTRPCLLTHAGECVSGLLPGLHLLSNRVEAALQDCFLPRKVDMH